MSSLDAMLRWFELSINADDTWNRECADGCDDEKNEVLTEARLELNELRRKAEGHGNLLNEIDLATKEAKELEQQRDASRIANRELLDIIAELRAEKNHKTLEDTLLVVAKAIGEKRGEVFIASPSEFYVWNYIKGHGRQDAFDRHLESAAEAVVEIGKLEHMQ